MFFKFHFDLWSRNGLTVQVTAHPSWKGSLHVRKIKQIELRGWGDRPDKKFTHVCYALHLWCMILFQCHCTLFTQRHSVVISQIGLRREIYAPDTLFRADRLITIGPPQSGVLNIKKPGSRIWSINKLTDLSKSDLSERLEQLNNGSEIRHTLTCVNSRK